MSETSEFLSRSYCIHVSFLLSTPLSLPKPTLTLAVHISELRKFPLL